MGKKWQEILSELTSSHEENLLKVNKHDLLRFCFENTPLRKRVEEYLKSIKKTRKDRAVALQKREEANRNLLEKHYQESLLLYTESIFHAPRDDEILPISYANRSFAFQLLGHLTECVADIDMAISTGYPKEKIKKLKLRKAKCLEQLKNTKESRQESTNYSSSKLNKKPTNTTYQLPEVAGGENKDFASASAHLSVYFDETKGRHVIANKNIQLGEVLFVEKAFAFVLCEQACAHCLNKTMAPIPCEICSDVTYCSSKCREDSWKSVHSFYCGFGELFKSVGIAHLGLQVVIAASSSLVELKNKLNSISEPKYKNGIVSFKSKGYESVYNLVHHTDKFEIKDLFQYVMTALLLATYMKNHTTYFPAESEDEDLKLLTSVILRHILQMICNGHAVMAAFIRGTKESMVISETEHRIATAIYPSVSMMNHSCLPSVVIGFYKTYIIVQAAKEIKKGEEVFNCYGADARRMGRAHRQEILRKQYFFKCDCQVCSQLHDIHDKFTAFKCSACKGPFVQKQDTFLEGICMDCGQKSEIPVQLILKAKDFYSLLNESRMPNVMTNDLSLKKSLMAWRLGRDIFYRFHKDLSLAADTVAQCLAIKKDYKRCASFLRCSILSVEERFGLLSIELIAELNKLLDVDLAYISSNTNDPYSEDMFSKNAALYRKMARIVQILNGNPYVDSIKLNSLEEVMQAFL